MLSILKTLSFFSGSRGPHRPDLPSPCGRKFHFSLHSLRDDVRSISPKRRQHKQTSSRQNCSFRKFYNKNGIYGIILNIAPSINIHAVNPRTCNCTCADQGTRSKFFISVDCTFGLDSLVLLTCISEHVNQTSSAVVYIFL